MKGAWVGGLAVGLFVLGGLLVALLHPAREPSIERVAAAGSPAVETPAPEAEPEPEPAVISGPRVVVGSAIGRYGPIWGVRVTARDAANGTPLAQVATDETGAYRIDLTGYDARVVDLLAERDVGEGVLVLERRGLVWDEPGDVSVDFRWATPGSTRGRVVDLRPLRLPVGIVVVELRGRRPSGPVRLFAIPADEYRREFGPVTIHPALLSRVSKETVLTDAAGRFEFLGLAPGRYRIVSGQLDCMCDAPVEFDAGSHDVVVELVGCVSAAVCPYDQATLEPLAGARLVAEFAGERRVATGTGPPLWLRTPAGDAHPVEPPRFLVEAEGYRTREFQVLGTGAQRVSLLPDVPANGRVVLRYQDGSAFEGECVVSASNPDGGGSSPLEQGPGGRLEPGLPPGRWLVAVTLSGYPVKVPRLERLVQVEGGTDWVLAFTVERGGVVELIVPEDVAARSDAEGEGSTEVWFRRLASARSEEPIDFALSTPWGVVLTGTRTTVERVPPGRYEVLLFRLGGSAEVIVEPGVTTVVREWSGLRRDRRR